MDKLQHYLHGECNIYETKELPKGAKKLNNWDKVKGLFIMADSETQGNYHVIEEKDYEQFISFYEFEGKLFMKADKDFTVRCLDVSRHGRMTIPAGIWKRSISMESDPFTELKRKVID